MKKLEGILTIFGVVVIIGLPLFLMFADIKDVPANGLSDSYISVQSYAEEQSSFGDIEFEEAYPVLDGEEARLDINDAIDVINDDVIPLGLTPYIEEEPVIVTTPVYVEPVKPEISINREEGSDVINSEEYKEFVEQLIDDTETSLLDTEEFEDIIPEGLELDEVLPEEETVIDTNSYEEFGEVVLENEQSDIEFFDEMVPESVMAIEEEFGDIEDEVIFVDDALPEAVSEYEEASITIVDSDIPQALLEAGSDMIAVSDFSTDDYACHSVRMDYIEYDEYGNQIVKTVVFSY